MIRSSNLLADTHVASESLARVGVDWLRNLSVGESAGSLNSSVGEDLDVGEDTAATSEVDGHGGLILGSLAFLEVLQVGGNRGEVGLKSSGGIQASLANSFDRGKGLELGRLIRAPSDDGIDVSSSGAVEEAVNSANIVQPGNNGLLDVLRSDVVQVNTEIGDVGARLDLADRGSLLSADGLGGSIGVNGRGGTRVTSVGRGSRCALDGRRISTDVSDITLVDGLAARLDLGAGLGKEREKSENCGSLHFEQILSESANAVTRNNFKESGKVGEKTEN